MPSSQHPHDNSQLSTTPVPGNPVPKNALFLLLNHACDTYTSMQTADKALSQNTNIKKNLKKIKKINAPQVRLGCWVTEALDP